MVVVERKLLRTFEGHTSYVWSVAVSLDVVSLFFCQDDNMIG